VGYRFLVSEAKSALALSYEDAFGVNFAECSSSWLAQTGRGQGRVAGGEGLAPHWLSLGPVSSMINILVVDARRGAANPVS